ncbi:PAS domain-containing sensor histidine kinase [Hymenobacter weizhouensis]|uniref:PAS domain-containing sensor histidine kinase n=1 Tax=Hymenobacter sp. YIM 151500-1 TaxID=2987689 RepID=UPI0022267EA0|nr:ATP-binding protein [Hymenobacter sp. YIM 151500-1]UYZ63642.1 ATP-binding protein [Hymenobacter sp. YIM 151500-1]
MAEFGAVFTNQAEASAHIQFIYDEASGRVIYVNPAYEQVLYGSREHVNEELPDLLARLHPDDKAYLAHYLKLWRRGQMPDEVELRLQRPKQPDQWLCLTPHWEQTGAGTALLAGTLRDISVDKRYQQHADAFNTRKNATLEILSHDLSSTFVMVQQISSFLREEVPVEGHAADLLQALETTSQQSLHMIRELVNIEFLESANIDLKRERVEVGAALDPALEELQRRQDLLGHRFEYELPAEPVYAYLDVNKFTQVLNNLVGNAIKFTPDGGRITVQVEPGPDFVRIRVMDKGIGIPAELQPYLFERFTKARRVGLWGEEATGLGLVLCKTIVDWHQGTITVFSTEGQGTTFMIELPRASA